MVIRFFKLKKNVIYLTCLLIAKDSLAWGLVLNHAGLHLLQLRFPMRRTDAILTCVKRRKKDLLTGSHYKARKNSKRWTTVPTPTLSLRF